MAKLTVVFNAANLVADGFGTEGVAAGAPSTLSIQVALVVAGVSYASTAPVKLKISPKNNGATIGLSPFSRSGN